MRLPYSKKTAPIENLGRYLRQLREDMGFSIHETARQTGLSAGYISRIELGKTFKSINVETLIKLSNVYGIPLNAILENAGFLEKAEDDLPGFAVYLRIKYNFPPQAVRDMEIAKEVVEKKYYKKRP